MYRSGQSVAVTSRMDVQLNNKSVSHKSSTLTVGAPLNPGTPLSVASPLSVGSPLCEDGRAYVTDPVTGRQMCMCSLGVGNDVHFPHLNMGHEARKQGALSASGGSPHCLGFDTSAFCSPVIRGLPMRPDRMPPYLTTGIPGHSMSFDPALAGHPYGLLYQGMDMNGPMRKAATRETTGPLKAWLSEHKKNPYPTKAEKIMLAIITKMTLTQVSTWFANARRRLKKDNRLTTGGGEDDSIGLDSDREGDSDSVSIDVAVGSAVSYRTEGKLSSEGEAEQDSFSDISDDENDVFGHLSRDSSKPMRPRSLVAAPPSPRISAQPEDRAEPPRQPPSQNLPSTTVKPKPKIWSISHILDS